MSEDIKILLVDDHHVMREGLRALLNSHGGFNVVGEAGTGREAVEMVERLAPDVIVMDIRMPDLNGIDATRQAIGMKPGVKVIALSATRDDEAAVAMLKAGAAGYVPKECAFEEVAAAIHIVMKNKVYFSPHVIARAAINPNSDSVLTRLTQREREVLQLVAEGKATKEVASLLSVSVKTVETHRRNVMEKLGVNSVAELTKCAIRGGLTEA